MVLPSDWLPASQPILLQGSEQQLIRVQAKHAERDAVKRDPKVRARY